MSANLPVAGNIRIGVPVIEMMATAGPRFDIARFERFGHAAAGRSDDRGGPGHGRWRRTVPDL